MFFLWASSNLVTISSAGKRKSYTVKEKLSIIERVKKDKSKAKIRKEIGIPEATICGWMGEAARLQSFVDKIESSGLERKKRDYQKMMP